MPDFSANGFCTAMNLLGGLIFGYGCIGINGALVKLYPCMLGLLPEHENTWGIAMLISSVNLGGLLGSAVIAKLTRQFHPCTIIVAGCAFCACALLGMFTSSYAVHFASRLLTGVGIGIICTVCPAYVVEICSPSHRGALGGLFQVSIALGIAVSAILSHFVMGSGRDLGADDICRLMSTNGSAIQESIARLRLMLILLFCVPVLLAVIALMKKFASTASREYRDKSYAPTDGLCVLETSASQKCTLTSRDQIIDEFPIRVWKARKAMTIAFMCAVALQLTGINAVMYYTFKFLDAAGVAQKSFGTIIIMLVNLSATLIALAVADRLGRRPLLITGLIAMTVSMLTLCFAGNYLSTSKSITSSTIGFLILSVYIYGFGIGPGFHFWIVCNEVLPSMVGQEGFAMANIAQWIFLILVTFLFPPLESVMGSYVFVLYAIPGLLTAVFFYLCLPETNGLSKSTIERILASESWIL